METSWLWRKTVFLNFQFPKVHLKLSIPRALTVKITPRQLIKPTMFSNYAYSVREGGCAGASTACYLSGGHPVGTVGPSHGTVTLREPMGDVFIWLLPIQDPWLFLLSSQMMEGPEGKPWATRGKAYN